MRVLVTGGRDYTDARRVSSVLDALHSINPITTIITGGATGADEIAGRWAERGGLCLEVYPADWSTHGRAAGPIRNTWMAAHTDPDLVLAFPGGRGTENMVSVAHMHELSVLRVAPRAS